MRIKSNIALISLIFLIVGLEIVGYGIASLSQSTFHSTSSQTSESPLGFVFGASDNLTQEASDFRLHLEKLDCRQETVEAKLTMNVVCQELEKTNPFYNAKSIFFLLQIPSEIRNVEVVYKVRDPQFFGGNTQILNNHVLNNGISAILVEIPKENFTFGKPMYFAFNFEMKNAFSMINPYSYEMVVTFSNNFDASIENSNSLKNVFAYSTTIFRWLRDVELYVEQPIDFPLSQVMPVPQGIHYYSNHTQYSWDVKAISTSFGSDSIILSFDDTATKNMIASRENQGWFSLGLGIPLGISSIFELLKVKKELLFKVREKKTQTILIILLVTAILLILFFVQPILW